MSVPIVPLSAFSNLAGPALAEDLRRLVANPVFTGLVLFSDTLGENLAILPLGPGQRYEQIDQVAGVEIEGLRPLCAMGPSGDAGGADAARGRELARLEEDLKARERQLVEREKRLAEASQALAEREQALLAKERDFFRQGGELASRAKATGAVKRSLVEAHG